MQHYTQETDSVMFYLEPIEGSGTKWPELKKGERIWLENEKAYLELDADYDWATRDWKGALVSGKLV